MAYCLLLLSGTALAAQQDPLAKAFDLERRGNYQQAVEIYNSVLQSRPAELAALLGLERSLAPLNRGSELLPAVRTALATGPASGPVYAIAIRAWAAADQPDSLEKVVERWAASSPGDETPYREWGAASLQRRDRQTARKAYLLGRERLGRPDVLAAELAQLAIQDQDYATALREWLLALRAVPGYRSSAVNSLAQAPARVRDDLLHQLEHEDSPVGLRLAVDLRARWGDPGAALKLLLSGLPSVPAQQVEALRQFVEQIRTQNTPAASTAQGMALEALAERLPTQQQGRVRLDAARAYAAGGDRASARRMLTRIAGDSNAPGIATGATATLIGLLVDEGKVDEAARRLEEFRAALPVDDYQRLRRTVALGWAQHKDLDQAERLVAGDSTVEGMALLGRLRLYRGDLKGALDALRAAGPFAGSQQESTARATLLALLQPIEADTVVPLGAAFLTLDRGDTAGAAKAFASVGQGMPPDKGGAELQLFAGRLLAAAHQPEPAEKLFRSAIVKEAPGTAAAASLELGRLLVNLDRREEAGQVLEQMILEYPASALVPQARRLLDVARGAVPRT